MAIKNKEPKRRNAPVGDMYAQERPPHKKKKKKSKILIFIKKLFSVIVTTLISLFLVMIITGTIVATALTVYVLDFMEESVGITLTELESGSNTYLYGTEIDEEGNEQLTVLKEFKTDVQRIPVDIEKVPQHVRNAFVAVEDERFYAHDGVDYKRTLSAFLNMFLHFYDTEQGGSTITQQLIKNLTHAENDRGPEQKIREIFAAMQLEKNYSKDEILEEYLNFIGFGGPYNGIQQASIEYFGKNVENLTVPEAAVLAAIPKSPNYYGPQASDYEELENGEKVQILDGEANNKIRQRHVLWQMYKNGYITYDEYQEYINTKVLFTHDPEYKALHPEVDLEKMKHEETANTWEVDAMIREAEKYLMEMYNIDQLAAEKRLYKGGYRIYSTIDVRMQNYVQEKFLDINNFLSANYVRKWIDNNGDGVAEEELPHVAFSALRYDGSVMVHIGNWGEKVGSLGTDYCDTDGRQIGSTVKPITTYGLALETDHIHWGSKYRDVATGVSDEGKPWPYNYDGPPRGGSYHIYYALQQSFNTIPAQLLEELGIDAVFEFSTEKLGLSLNEVSDKVPAALAIGSFYDGVPLQELVGAYIPYGNKGIFNPPHIISRIEDANHKVIYRNDDKSIQAVSEETAWVMNRLLKNVVEHGTGTAGRLGNKVVAGKTGTTEDWNDSTFVGLTRDFVSGLTVGYKGYGSHYRLPESYHAVSSWTAIIGDYANTMFPDTGYDFDPCDTVIQASMCSSTGLIAGSSCPRGATGYWKSSNAPYCQGGHYVAPTTDASGDSGTGTGGGAGAGAGVGGVDVGGGAGAGAGGGVDVGGGAGAGAGGAVGEW